MNETFVEQKEFSVSEISFLIKKEIETKFCFVKIRGEISGLKIAPSGHVYFSLKDKDAVLASICWKGSFSSLKFKPEEGLEVICIGSITTYAGQSKYQFIVQSMEHAGIGALMALLEERKKRLALEGLFDQAHKKPLPFLPQIIGIVTSPTGAVIKDILHRLEDRFPVYVLLWPVLVQGDKSAEQVAKAVRGFNSLSVKPDLIIVARGGGSFEDLFSFNEEVVVRAVYESEIPVISAIGHETDYTLIDLVADLRAPTPTAAAEIAVPVRNDLLAQTQDYRKRMFVGLTRSYQMKKTIFDSLARSLPKYDNIIDNFVQRIDDLSIRMNISLNRKYEKAEVSLSTYSFEKIKISIDRIHSDKMQKLKLFSSLIDSYSYQNTLKRGYTLISKKNELVKSSLELNKNDVLSIKFSDGVKEVVVS
jgi:exodeoxyribonuclease VII large subunit